MATGTRKKRQARSDEEREAAKSPYIVLTMAVPDSDGQLPDLAEALEQGRVWIEDKKAARGTSGVLAVKDAKKRTDGAIEAGQFKGISASTWDADNNNLVSVVETKPVNTFIKPEKRRR